MKKCTYFFYLIILLLLASGCNINYNEYPSFESKPKESYYTNKLASELSEEEEYKAMLLETNFSTELDINAAGKDTIKNFLTNLSEESFIIDKASLLEIPKTPSYRLYINTNKDKYVVNIYTDSIISIHPWDGIFTEDYINMSTSPKAYNLFGLCKYLLENRQSS